MKLMDFTGFALKNLFSKPATKNYPAEPAVYPERSRGHIEIDIDDCIMCGMCQRKCPSSAITVDRNEKTWSINRDECVQCGACIDACLKFHSLSYAKDDGESGQRKINVLIGEELPRIC